MRVSAYDMYIQNYDMSATAWATMQTEFPNIKVKTFPKEVMDAMKKANAELLVEIKKESPIVKEVLESQEAYQKKVRKWTEMSDYLYLKDNL
jgi:TRAP-type mannitol/chloroaromatic compound transport system substrate-binding protein